ncbi:response regulator [Segetibacter koreensis]|uniref:response regulator n=1 Tax=Segetibacter koreensis TaxID=398037 RepID=UPI00036A44D2|nr:response regulator [Segetibacter koreensis]
MKKYKIIIVENDEDEQLFMKEGFASTGLFEIIAQVLNGDDLLDWLEEHQSTLPDLILSDLNMPGKNGYDVIELIKGNPAYRHIPVIITSTSSTKTIIDKCLAKGAADYVVKPDTFVQYVPYVKELYNLIEQKQLVK